MLLFSDFGKRTARYVLLGSLVLFSCCREEHVSVNLIPDPAEMQITDGYLKVDSALIFGEEGSSLFKSVIDESLQDKNPESYELNVTQKGIELKASTEAGLFYGKQTLRQLYTQRGIPYVSIKDAPRFPYRGLHVDVSRHFFPKEEILKLLDVMSYYKFNRLHLHLTDGGGWRIQIDKYPKLTGMAAFRTDSTWNHWGRDQKFLPEGTPGAYGGYYTKEDIRKMVAFAKERHITILPEIEFPGHSSEVFAAYPELCCAGKPYQGGDFCIGNEKTFSFMEDVLSEVIELFPSTYIHIGGDEASKRAWKTCPKCQALMRKHHMTDVDELQSYMIRRAEEFLISKGRKLIGWDEILEGGLAPEATVMSWRGEAGGIKAARMGHDVVMTPSAYMYFDAYQADPVTQPEAIGGFTPVKRVYSYNPVPVDSLKQEEYAHILGVQANTWSEFIPNSDHLEYMIFPRALALAEVAWTPQEKRDWNDFKPRLNAHIPILQRMGIHPFTLSNNIDPVMEVDTLKKEIRVILDAEKYPAEIRYTTDGTTPDASSPIYRSPILVKDSADIRAVIFQDGQPQGKVVEKRVDYHRGINKPIHYNSELFAGYMAGGMNALLDGYRGGLTYMDGRWQGYTNDLDCVVDMGEVTDIHKVSARFMQLTGPQVFQPGEVELSLSEDGVSFSSEEVIPTVIPNDDKKLSFQEYTFRGNWKARYIRVKAKEVNHKSFIFTDEIVIW